LTAHGRISTTAHEHAEAVFSLRRKFLDREHAEPAYSELHGEGERFSSPHNLSDKAKIFSRKLKWDPQVRGLCSIDKQSDRG
jgi:hypothetical protein